MDTNEQATAEIESILRALGEVQISLGLSLSQTTAFAEASRFIMTSIRSLAEERDAYKADAEKMYKALHELDLCKEVRSSLSHPYES